MGIANLASKWDGAQLRPTEEPIADWFRWVAETADYQGHGSGELAYPLFSMAAEAGELHGLCVRVMRQKGGGRAELNTSELAPGVRRKMAGEAYDVLHCLAFVIMELGMTLEEVIAIGREKLEARIRSGSTTASHRLDEKSLVGKEVIFLGRPYRLIAETLEVVVLEDSDGFREQHSRKDFYRGLEATE